LTLLRYLLKRWAFPFLGALLFYGGLLMAYEVVGVSKEIFTAGAPFRWLAPLLALAVPDNLGMVLPMAALLGGLMGTQHLSEGSESVAAQGLGVGMRAFLRPWLMLSVCLLGFASFNAHVLVPWANVTQNQAHTKMFEEARTRFLRPGAPPWFPPGSPRDAVWMAPDGRIHLMEVTPDSVKHLEAKSLTWTQSAKEVEKPNITLVLEQLQGSVIQKADGSVGLIYEKEHRYTFEVPPVRKLLRPTSARFMSTRALLAHEDKEAWVELARRFTLPVASCALLLLGVAVGLGHPRFQRGGAVVKSLAIILVYYVLLKVFENQFLLLKSPPLYVRLGLFLLPFAFLGAGFWLLSRKLHPHHSNRLASHPWARALRRRFASELHAARTFLNAWIRTPWRRVTQILADRGRSSRADRGVIAAWTRALWWRNWGSVVGTFLALSLLIEYAALAGDLAKNHVSTWVFVLY
jgi:lipopolysaccharide export LptBFGC system permease protein LptF